MASWISGEMVNWNPFGGPFSNSSSVALTFSKSSEFTSPRRASN